MHLRSSDNSARAGVFIVQCKEILVPDLDYGGISADYCAILRDVLLLLELILKGEVLRHSPPSEGIDPATIDITTGTLSPIQ